MPSSYKDATIAEKAPRPFGFCSLIGKNDDLVASHDKHGILKTCCNPPPVTGIFSVRSRQGIFSVRSRQGIFSVRSRQGIFSVRSRQGIFSVRSWQGLFSVRSRQGIFSVRPRQYSFESSLYPSHYYLLPQKRRGK